MVATAQFSSSYVEIRGRRALFPAELSLAVTCRSSKNYVSGDKLLIFIKIDLYMYLSGEKRS